MSEIDMINHLAEDHGEYLNSAAPPIFQTSNFCFKTVSEMRYSLENEKEVPFYTRGSNPTIDLLRKKMAALEHTEDALIFSSGSAAIAAAVMHCVKKGDHMICVQKPYSWTGKLLNQILIRYGVGNTMVDGTRVENFDKAIQSNTQLIFLESPNSWTYEMQDIKSVVQLARKHNIRTIMDNSHASPINCNPADYGVDIITHSATKYLNGHSDVVAGVLCASRELCNQIFANEFMTIGAVISPFNAWLMLRGLRTLPIRMKYIAENTKVVVDYLAQHARIEKVYYPFLPSFDQHELAQKYLKMGGGLFTVQLKTLDPAVIESVCNNLRKFLLGCSWGGYESLAFPAITLYTSQNYSGGSLPINMIRFYAGFDDPKELMEDLDQALRLVK